MPGRNESEEKRRNLKKNKKKEDLEHSTSPGW
jgi:hypothetical protein